jgi:uncharacterized protein
MTTLTLNSKPSFAASIRTLLAHHPFVNFFVLSFVVSWLLLAPMVLGQDGLGLLPYHVPFGLYVGLFLSATFAGPTLAALLITGALEGKEGIQHFLCRYGQWQVGWRWYLIFLVGFPALYLIPATLWMGVAPWQALIRHWPTLFTVYLPGLLIFPALINWGEEAGWRGFAQTRMQVHYGALPTSLLIGFLHGLWHLPVFLLVAGPPALGPFDLSTFLLNALMIMMFTVLWTWIFNGAKQSILIASLTHATFNATQAWIGTLLPNQPEQVGTSVTIVIVVSALLIIFLTKGRLGYAPKQSTEPDIMRLS